MDVDIPRSNTAFLPVEMRQWLEIHAVNQPDLFNLDEKLLARELKGREMTPSPTDNRLRFRLWDRYENSLSRPNWKPIKLQDLIAGICTYPIFEKYMKTPEKVAWLMCPPVNYAVLAEEALMFGLNQMREILEEPNREPNGKLNSALIGHKLRIVALLDARVRGAIVQKSLNIHTDMDSASKEIANLTENMTEDGLRKQLHEYDLREKRALHLTANNTDIIEVEPGGEAL